MDKIVFLDRDGVINKKMGPHIYVTSYKDFEFLPKVKEAIKKLNDNGFKVVIISNQRGIARGLVKNEDVDLIHKKMQDELLASHAYIDGIYICPHEAGTCECRKPKPGLFYMAEKDFDVDKSMSYMIGDSESDILAGKAYGIETILVNNSGEYNSIKKDNLFDAVEYILTRNR